MTITVRHRHTDPALISATTGPDDPDPPTHLDLSQRATAQRATAQRARLAKVWAHNEAGQVMSLAGPDLTAGIGRLLDDGTGTPTVEQLCRADLSVPSYPSRWRRHPTPSTCSPAPPPR